MKMSNTEECTIVSDHPDSVDEPLVEIFKISGCEYRKKSQIEKLEIKNMVVRCTACLHQINHHDISELRKHVVLNVLVCKACAEFYGDGEFSQDESGSYNYCTWCGNGGKLFLCDYCPGSFCSTCVRRNFGRREVSLMSKEGWKCYRCNPNKLKAKKAYCNLILEYSADIKKKRDKTSKSESLFKSKVAHVKCSETQDWVLPVFDQFDDACKTFQRRLEKLKEIGISQSKSLKHVIKKMEEIVVAHKTELNRTIKSLSNQYVMYIQNKMKAEEKLKKTNEDMVIKVNGPIKQDGHSEDKSNDTDFNYQAKVSLLADSSESNVSDEGSKSKRSINVKTEDITLNGHISSSDEISEIVCLNPEITAEEVKDEDSDFNPTVKKQEKTKEDDISEEKDYEISDKKDGDIPDEKDNDIPDKIDNDIPDKIDNDIPDKIDNDIPDKIDNDIPDKIDNDIPDKIDNDIPDKIDNDNPEIIDNDNPDKIDNDNPEIIDNDIPDKIDNDNPEIIDNDIPEKIDNDIPDKIDNDILDKIVNGILDKKDNDISDKKDNDVSVKKDNDVSDKKDNDVSDKKDNDISDKKDNDISDKKDNDHSDEGDGDISDKNDDISVIFTPKKTKKKTKKSLISKLNFSESDSSSSIQSLSDDTKKTKPVNQKRIQHKPKHRKSIDVANDPKLKCQSVVVLQKCDNLLPNGETTIPVPASYKLEDLDKEIYNLCKLPKKIIDRRNTSSKEKKKKTAAPKKAKKRDSDEWEGESSSSICFSSEEENEKETKKNGFKKNKDKDANEIAKDDLIASDSDVQSPATSTSGSSDDEEPTKKKSKRATQQSGSSEDFKPVKKKKKYDRLLNKRLFSDSEKENEKKEGESKKQKKRKQAISDDTKSKNDDSDSMHTTTSESDSDHKKKKKRKRIKKRATSESDSNEAKEKEASQSTPKKGRKDIKKILSKKDLAEETREAQMAERERRKRVQDRQKLYNVIQECLGGNEVVIKKLVLEVDPVSKEEVVQLHPDLIEKLKPHQVEGIKFMWECTIESLKELETSKGSGCILAHCMGLGKTLQVITFLHTCMTNPIVNKKIKTAMVICPYNTVLNWRKEFDKWLEEVEGDIPVHEMTVAKENYMRLDILKFWQREGGVLILSYDIFRRLSANKIPKMTKKNREKVHELLIDPGADIVICDEGHVLKNVTSAISKACSNIGTERRIVLTGTPLQNNLMEYHCMLSFVKPHLLGTPKEFRNRFVNPIMNGQYDDSNEYDVKRMKKRIHILHKLLGGCVQRCDYSALTKFLPPKHEYVLSLKLTEVQTKMYRWYLDNLSRGKKETRGGALFQDYNILRNICTHPYLIHKSFQRSELRKMMQDDDEELDDFIVDGSDEEADSSSSNSEREEVIKTHRTRSRAKELGSDVEEEEEIIEQKKEWYHDFITDEDEHKLELSGKMILLIDILKECEAIGDKVVLFSQSLLTLDIIEEILGYLDEQPVTEDDEKRDITCRWLKNIDYYRMDGSTSAEFRKNFIDRFNDPLNDRARLFLVSTKAGGLGTNLVGANRVVMLDASWNPSHDVQAIFRVYRFGQIKPVYIYRLLGQSTMEEKIYDRQVTKLSLSIRVVDEQQIDRHFNAAELAELYTFEPELSRDRPTPMLPADNLLAEMLKKHQDLIVTYHEHDSLLENKTEEDLTEEERKAAWDEYENEREGRAPAAQINIDDEMKEYVREPDFDQADYVGNILPNCKDIIEGFIQKLKIKFPDATVDILRKKLLMLIHTLRATYQDKHVKVLRMKQEFVARGSVPVAINKYLDELSVVLRELTRHYENVSHLVMDDARKVEQARIAQQKAFLQQQMNRPQVFGFSQPQYYTSRPGFTSQFNANTRFIRVPHSYAPPGDPRAFNNMIKRMHKETVKKFASAAPTTLPQQPLITEVDKEDEPEVVKVTNTKSSVTIEEVE